MYNGTEKEKVNVDELVDFLIKRREGIAEEPPKREVSPQAEPISETAIAPEPEAVVEPEPVTESETVAEPEEVFEPEVAAEPEIAPAPAMVAEPQKKKKRFSLFKRRDAEEEDEENTCYLSLNMSVGDNLDKDLSVKSISKNTNISKSVLYKLFSTSSEYTVSEYINRQRIAAAKRMLLQTDMSIEEISKKCGYTSSDYFGRVFKKFVKLSPQQYRKEYSTSLQSKKKDGNSDEKFL